MAPVVRFPLAFLPKIFLEFNSTADPLLRPSTFWGAGDIEEAQLISPTADAKEFQPFPGSLSEAHASKSELGI